MGLSCSCSEDGDWWYFPPDDYSTLAAKRGRRCCSCREWIRPGATVAKFIRERAYENDIEWRIHGDEVPMAPLFMCERCADLFFSLDELGYCINLNDDMRDLVRQYAEMKADERAA